MKGKQVDKVNRGGSADVKGKGGSADEGYGRQS